MRNEKKTNRLFIGASVVAIWPESFPSSEVIKEQNRHVTILFLDGQDQQVKDLLKSFPRPENQLSPAGVFFKYVGLPKKSPHLVALEGKLLSGVDFKEYRDFLLKWAEEKQIEFKRPTRPFYPHLTICRKKTNIHMWEKTEVKIPFYVDGINLYKSHGNSEYEKLKTHSFIPAFEQIHHTADIAFSIRGDSLQSIFVNAQMALAFTYPDFLDFLEVDEEIFSQDQIVMRLNKIVASVDIEIGCPFKAISFHGVFKQDNLGYIQWEMIVDV